MAQVTASYFLVAQVGRVKVRLEEVKLAQVTASYFLVVPHSKSGIVPRSSLLGAGQVGFWEVGKGGTIG